MPPTTSKTSVIYPEDISGLLCLPPVSDELQVTWARAELTEELDEHPQLVNTFSFFPYPSMPEIALLSLRYGLEMEKVKNWFMAQRIRCGISWTAEEIEDTRARLNYNQEQLNFKPLISLAKKSNVLRNEDFSVHTAKMAAMQTAASNPCLDLGKNAPVTKKKLAHKTPDKEAVRIVENTLEARRKHLKRNFSNDYNYSPPTLNLHPKKRRENESPVRASGSGLMLGTEGNAMSIASYPAEGERRRSSWKVNSREVAPGSAYFDHNGTLRRDELNLSNIRRQRKTKEQLQILKAYFLKTQWATREDYMHLEGITGLSRAEIIQWFGDTRYALKHGHLRWFHDSIQERPSWLDDPQHIPNANGKHNSSVSPSQVLNSSVPVEELTASSSQHSGNAVEDDDDYMDNEPTFSGKSKPTHRVSNFKLLVTNCSTPKISQRAPMSPALQENYNVLENYWRTHGPLQEEDLEQLVAESDLSHQEVLNWFSYKSKEHDEVEICVVEDEDDNTEDDDDDDDVVIQD
ncbi:homeobox and leucine zipper protein Homez [Hyperolius riggenbachi]|uniref:homeobox and leucine zipper protein Homez n=1 Tax=Hyperolius riggenbachi TaxID=752182 RepID=UPI0035A369E7